MNKNFNTDVCIVGGGIVGLSTAYFLSLNKISVIVLDPDSIGSHASGFAFGGLSPLGEAGQVDEIISELSVARLGMSIHTEFAKILPELTGIDIQHRFRPAIDLTFSDEEAKEAKDQVKWRASEDGYSVEWLEAKEALDMVPEISNEITGAVFTKGVADVEPYRLMLALTTACEKMGVNIISTKARGLGFDGHTATSVISDRGDIHCNSVVLAMGPWSLNASKWINQKIPIRPLKGQILRLKSDNVNLQMSVGWQGNYACTKPDGLLWAGTTEEDVGFDDSPSSFGRDSVLASLTKMINGLESAELIHHTACLRPLSNDGKIILGEVPDTSNLYIASGTGRKGILLGPGMGKITSDIITGSSHNYDLTPFNLSRF